MDLRYNANLPCLVNLAHNVVIVIRLISCVASLSFTLVVSWDSKVFIVCVLHNLMGSSKFDFILNYKNASSNMLTT